MSTKVSAINPVQTTIKVSPEAKPSVSVALIGENQLQIEIERENQVFKINCNYRESADAVIFCNAIEIMNEILSLPLSKVLEKYKKQ
jgi:rRNA processing protein Krr1/Pno1